MKITAEDYIADVHAGKIVANTWTKLAVQRHLADLESGPERGLYFDQGAAIKAINFFQFCKHSKGEWAGTPVTLAGWQQFIQWVVFGWKREDGTRRFKTVYEEVARKNGKTTKLAGVGLYLLMADDEPGAEVYSAATKRDQARLSHQEATRMVKSSPMLARRATIHKDNIFMQDTASRFVPLGRDSNTMDGLNVHGALIDELHAHKTREVWDILDTATGSRRQPIQWAITTAGYNRQSICYEQHDYTRKILQGVLADDSFFGIIYGLDDGEVLDWHDESLWIKANPNLGVSVKVEDLQRKAAKAKEIPTMLNAFLRLHLNVWTEAETRWLSADKWRLCGGNVNQDGLAGRSCWAGLDLSSTTDLSALVLIFPPAADGDRWQSVSYFWIPEDSIAERSHRDRVPYDAWVRQGYIEATPGNVIDYDYIVARILDIAERFNIEEIAFDRWGAAQMVQNLQEYELPLVQFGQGFPSMSPPMKELERLVVGEQLNHGNNPVLTWCADNVVARVDPAGNIKPDKEKSIEKIDGVVALIMALARATAGETKFESVYKTRGLTIL